MKKQPFFLSAPRLVLGIRTSSGFTKIGYAIGLSMNLSVTVLPVFCLGDMAPLSYEPSLYQPVTGSFQIVRLQRKALRDARVTNAKTLYNKSNILQNTDPTQGVNQNPENTTNSVTENTDLSDHLDPNKIITSSTFDIEVYLNVNGYGHSVNSTDVASVAGQPSTTIPTLSRFLTIQDCRITGRSVNLAQAQIVNEPLTFVGLLAITQAGEQEDNIIKDTAV